MEGWKKDSRREVVMVDIDELVPKDHLLRKVERVMDYDWIYEKLDSYYNHDVGRPGTDPVVLMKMVLIQHLFGIPSLRQTHREIQVNLAYRWFLGYSLLDNIPHFATVSYAFCNRFPSELSKEIFTHILNKALNNRMVDPSVIFVDGTQIKASANNKKRQKELVAQTAKIYDEQLRKESMQTTSLTERNPLTMTMMTSRQLWWRKRYPLPTQTLVYSVKGEHKTEFAYEAHTACDCNGFILDVEVTAGNVHDSVAFDAVYEKVTERFHEVETVSADSAYKTPWITKRIIDDGRIPSMPYTRASNIKPGMFRQWEYIYDIVTESYTCPRGGKIKTYDHRQGRKEKAP